MKNILFLFFVIAILAQPSMAQKSIPLSKKTKSVFMDKQGIIRWEDGKELALFGANYSLPSACDYRAAGMIGADRKKMVDDDMAHFSRMGWDGMRLCLWGDYENSDKEGNLIVNDHLDIMDYAIYKAKERGISILLTPITTYSSQWPDIRNETSSVKGFSAFYKKSDLGTNPEAIKVQVNYLKQMMNHVNPYTGVALKDEPAILFIEPINEPIHHPNDFDLSVNYINTLADAIKSTGCKKLLFHNVSQDMKIAKAIKASKMDGASFAWYPMGLTSGQLRDENFLRAVDDYMPMHTPDLAGKAKLVYEFDEADAYSPYMYPAMVRSFRAVGAQFITMFSYDMLATAPYNLGWQSHVFNMVYYPQKAAAGIIAAEEMKNLPLYKNYGSYPENTSFGPVHINYQENKAELITKEKFLYSNNTYTLPSNIKSLNQIVGYGSSPLVSYPGKGLYFLDKVENGVWRLEVYPDALIISDLFAQMSKDKVVSRLVNREWPMQINLPDLGSGFFISTLNAGNSYTTTEKAGKFMIRPGVYVLSVKEKPSNLPAVIGQVKFNEFVCPEPANLPINVLVKSSEEHQKGQKIVLNAEVIDLSAPDEVNLYYRPAKNSKDFRMITMTNTGGYTYEAVIPAEQIEEGLYKYVISVTQNQVVKTYPEGIDKKPSDWDFYGTNQWQFSVVSPNADLSLLDPDSDYAKISYTRIGDGGRVGDYSILPVGDLGNTAIRFNYPIKANPSMKDYTMSIPVKKLIRQRGASLKKATSIIFRLKGELKGQIAFVTIMESDGTSWSKEINIERDWQTLKIPFSTLKSSRGVLLPLGYPEQWNYWVNPAQGRGAASDKLQIEQIERIQISFRASDIPVEVENPFIDLSAVSITFN